MPDNHTHYLNISPGPGKTRITIGPPIGEGVSHIHNWQTDEAAGQTGPGIAFPGGHLHSLSVKGGEHKQVTSPQVYQPGGMNSLGTPKLSPFFSQMLEQINTEQINSIIQKLIKEINRDVKFRQTIMKRNIRYLAKTMARFIKK